MILMGIYALIRWAMREFIVAMIWDQNAMCEVMFDFALADLLAMMNIYILKMRRTLGYL